MEAIAEERDIEIVEIINLSVAHNKIYELENNKVNYLRQKAKIKWALDGDENSKFFHCIINNKYRRQSIKGISHNGIWITDPLSVKECIFELFSNKFKEGNSVRPSFFRNFFHKMSNSRRVSLERTF